MTNDSLDETIDRATNVLALVADLSAVMMAAPDGGPELSSNAWAGLSELLGDVRRQLQEVQAQVPNVVIHHRDWPEPHRPECARVLRELADLHERFYPQGVRVVPTLPEGA